MHFYYIFVFDLLWFIINELQWGLDFGYLKLYENLEKGWKNLKAGVLFATNP